PTVSDQLGVLQSMTVVFPILMTLARLVRFSGTGRLSQAIGIAFWLAACFHTSSNMALLFGPTVLLGVVVLGGRQLIRTRPAAAPCIASCQFSSAAFSRLDPYLSITTLLRSLVPPTSS